MGIDTPGPEGEMNAAAATPEKPNPFQEKPIVPGFSPEEARQIQAEAARQIAEQKARIDQMIEPEESSGTVAQPSERDIPTQVIMRPGAPKPAPKKSLWSRIFGK